MNFTTWARMSAWESRDELTSTPEKEDDGSGQGSEDTNPLMKKKYAKKSSRANRQTKVRDIEARNVVTSKAADPTSEDAHNE
jgi:hypothetical protein